MNSIIDFIKKNPAKCYGYVVALVTCLMAYFPSFPQENVLSIVSAVIAIICGHSVQKTEDRKTTQALYGTTTEQIPEHLRDSPARTSNF